MGGLLGLKGFFVGVVVKRLHGQAGYPVPKTMAEGIGKTAAS